MKKNYYELTEEEIEKYSKEWSQTPYYKMTMKSFLIGAGISFFCALFILLFTIFESDPFSVFVGAGLAVLVTIIGMAMCYKMLMKLEQDFPRWLKIKHDIEY